MLGILRCIKKLPSKIADEESYVLIGKEVKICFGKFKTRMRMGETFMKPFKRTLPAPLASLIKNHIKKEDLKDDNYLFYSGTDKSEQFTDNAFSKKIKQASKNVIGVDLTANDYRHAYMDFITDHFKEFNDNDLKQIAMEMGDSNVYTALKYRFAQRLKENETVTEINERIIEEREMKANKLIHDEAEGSRMVADEVEEESVDTPINDINDVEDIMERTTVPLPVSSNDELIKRLAELEVEKIKIMLLLFQK